MKTAAALEPETKVSLILSDFNLLNYIICCLIVGTKYLFIYLCFWEQDHNVKILYKSTIHINYERLF